MPAIFFSDIWHQLNSVYTTFVSSVVDNFCTVFNSMITNEKKEDLEESRNVHYEYS